MHFFSLAPSLRRSVCTAPKLRTSAARLSTSTTRQTRNQVFDRVRDPASLSTYLSLSAKSSTPLLTLFTAGYCPTCRHVLPLVKQLVSSGVGDDATTNGVNFAEVEFDAPDNMELGQRYMITSLPTLLGFDGRREEVVARLVDGRKLADKQFLEEWIWEQAKRGGGGGGGGGSSGEKGLFGGLFGSWKSY